MEKFSIFICIVDAAKSMTLTQWNFEGEDMYQRVDDKDILGHWETQPGSGSFPFKFVETPLLEAYHEGGAVFICNNNDHIILLKKAFVEYFSN